MLLTAEELHELTLKRRGTSQAEVLRALGIAYRIRPDGSLAVLRVVAEIALGGQNATTQKGPASPALRLPKARPALVRAEREVDSARR
jgi:hypothetical protein